MAAGIFALTLAVVISPHTGLADVTVSVAGPGGQRSQTLPNEGGSFEVDLPLTRNADNRITVTATDAAGNELEKTIRLTQLSLQDIVVAEVTTERLPPERVEQLVNDGVIELDDPDNFNVSQFDIVLTIAKEPVPISIPIVFGPSEPTGSEVIQIPAGGGRGGRTPRVQDVEIIVFETTAGGSGGGVPIPGVIIIEGRIKSLKEFFSVRLLLMNTSGIFTLQDINACLLLPEGALSHTLPENGTVFFGDILPGDGGVPGQKEREFIIRGDEVGIHELTVDFGGTVSGPGIPEDEPVPFSGSATSSVEVKGPPEFLVQVSHPPSVVAGVPYELLVDITNTGELPALYASLELEVGAAAELLCCGVNEVTGEPECETITGADIRNFGHIFPGETVRESFLINPLDSGPISSCFGISDQNIQLQVSVGNIGCLTGHFPPEFAEAGDQPTVAIIPTPNAQGVNIDSPVVAFFSKRMQTTSIRTGEGRTFNVFDEAREVVPGQIIFEELNDRTIAIWQVLDGVVNRLNENEEYLVVLTDDIVDEDGNRLFNPWSSTFKTTSEFNDLDPPELSLTILPPTDPNAVIPGEAVIVNAYPADQGSGVDRVEFRIKDLDTPGALFELVDQKTLTPAGTNGPCIFRINSADLIPGNTYSLKGSAFDRRGNVREATLAVTLAASADPPVIFLPADLTNDALQGVALPITPVAVSGGVHQVGYVLDESTDSFSTVFLPPWQAFLSTFDLATGVHTVRAVAIDGLNQTGQDEFVFNLATNPSEPIISFPNNADGTKYVTGSVIAIDVDVQDPVGVKSTHHFFDSTTNPPFFSGSEPYSFNTAGLSTGLHQVIVLASNKLGRANNPTDPDSILDFVLVNAAPGPAPAPPVVTNISFPQDGQVTVQGTAVADGRVDILNTNLGTLLRVDVGPFGRFSGFVDGEGGHVLRLTAFDLDISSSASAATQVVVPTPPVFTNIMVTPTTVLFTAVSQFQDLTVTGFIDGGGQSNLTSRAKFSSDNPAAASVNAAGRVVANARGLAQVTATFTVLTAQTSVDVDIITLTNFAVSPPSVVLVFTGQTAQLTVTRQFSDGSTSTLGPKASFAVSDPAVVSVSTGGFLTAKADGNAQVYVSVGSLPPKDIPISVISGLNPPPTVQITSPADGSAVERGELVNITVLAEDPVGGVTRLTMDASGEVVASDSRQISPPANSVTRTFTISIPSGATLGGSIVVNVRAEDVAGLTSPLDTITLTVLDDTPPVVTLLGPAAGSAYGPGDTVTVMVAATDEVGVDTIGYTTEGALVLSGSTPISPSSTDTNASLTFIVPSGASEPELFIRGTARDTSGNEASSAPIEVELTGADKIAPTTVVTSVSAPGTSATTTVAYTVLQGIDDLDHVALYFRRDGYGTFNRYVNKDTTNTTGRFFPQSGTNGTIVFDSTKMGGDGFFEFYTVGVDENDNRELTPTNALGDVVPDDTVAISAGTVWTTVTAGVMIGDGDASLDNRNVRFSNAVVVIEGSHTFQNVELLGTAVVTHVGANLTNEPVFEIACWTLTVASNASINVDGRGYLGGLRNGNDHTGNTTNNADGATARSGGSHGGLGGAIEGTPNALYGNLVQPTDLGSGGSSNGGSTPGGDGGGRIRLNTLNIAADGNITANGLTGSGNGAGSGSGGSIFILTCTLSGTGAIRANGGGSQTAGGGGRVAIHYVDLATKDISLITALGGQGSFADGGNGSVFLKGLGESDGTLVIDGQGIASPFSGLPIPVGVTFDNIIIRNTARVVLDDPVTVNDSFQILAGSIVTHSTLQTNGLTIHARSVLIDGTSSIDVTDKGYRGGLRDGNASVRGETLHGQLGAKVRSAGSYGGLGYDQDGVGFDLVYGMPQEPVYLGAGGSSNGGTTPGGNGGGRVTIQATDVVSVQGAVRADGGVGSGNAAGSGAGGSIHIETSLLEGSGSISANGGGSQVGGGGGRIAITYDVLGGGTNNFDGLKQITAAGGVGSFGNGSPGTVFYRQGAQPRGDLYVDAALAGGTASIWTPLTPIGLGTAQQVSSNELVVDGDVALLPGGLVGLWLRPNVNSDTAFLITGNTASSIAVEVTGGTNLTDVASVGDTYAAEYAFDNLRLRRGAVLVTSDRLKVDHTLDIAEEGVLTHFDATLTYEPALHLQVGTLALASNGSINVDGRGYLGGGRNGNDGTGNTTNNTDGATARSGGSYGGLGAEFDGVPNDIYGDPFTPGDLGSGGSSNGSTTPGGDGAGRTHIIADNVLNNGTISANGDIGSGNGSGSGSGGSILIQAGSITGVGQVRANGGGSQTGGGGGRIAVHYTTLSAARSQFEALGGQGSIEDGGNGTVVFKNAAQANGDLVVDGKGIATPADTTPLPAGLVFDNVFFQNHAQISLVAPLVVSGGINILSNSTVRHPLSFSDGLTLQADSLLVDSNSTIDVSGRGRLGGLQAGNALHEGLTTNDTPGSTARSGGSYGGVGGPIEGMPNRVYGSVTNPAELGSGGSSNGATTPGGSGGGRISLLIADTLTVNGAVLADGAIGGGNGAGSGSGGSILVHAGTVNGIGTIQAHGGGSQAGGGGGRIAVYYDVLAVNRSQVLALGGQGSFNDGGNGTVFFKSSAQGLGDLVINGSGLGTPSDSTPILENQIFDNVTFENGARIILTSPLVVSGTVQVVGDSMVTHPVSYEDGLTIEAVNLLIDTNSAIDVAARGYRGGLRDGNALGEGLTTNEMAGSTPRSGGSYGGMGGAIEGVPNPVYGSATNPVHLGSGGSRSLGTTAGGNGGGRISLNILSNLVVDGSIRANGGTGAGNAAGSGSGGSVLILVDNLEGIGSIEADGGGSQTGGGGGRVAVYFASNALNTNSITARGGVGSFVSGIDGTVILSASGGGGGLPPGSAEAWARIVACQQNDDGTLTIQWIRGDSEGTWVVEYADELGAWVALGTSTTNTLWEGAAPLTGKGFFRVRKE